MSKSTEQKARRQLEFVRKNQDNLSALQRRYRKIGRAWDSSEGQLYLDFLDAMETYFFQQDLWREYVQKAERALPFCREVGNLTLEANTLNNIAVAYWKMGEL